MYYLLYGFLYLISLLPFFILYRISDLGFFIIFYIAGYRKEIVLNNLRIAFPEKSEAELKKIAKRFYRNLTDNFIETLKVLSLSRERFRKRCTIDFEAVRELEKKGFNIQFHSGHQMNWEFASLAISDQLSILWLAVYSRINTKAIDRLFIKIRGRYGAVMIEMQTYQARMRQLMKDQYALGLIADQNPPHGHMGYWLNFFSKPAPFLIGPEKGAMRNKTAVVFVNMLRLKRGRYHFECRVITEDASHTLPGELTRAYRTFLEESIRRQPDNYLWSHRRWKFDWQPDYSKRWIDISDPPL